MHRFATTTALTLTAAVFAADAHAGFESYVIRNDSGGNPPAILPNSVYVPDATEFVIGAASQKAAWGSNDINGGTIGGITSVAITRHDNTARFTGGSGQAVAPYFNIWIRNAAGTQYAVLANEPSNPGFQPLFVSNGDGSKSYDLSFSDLSSHPVQVYETVNGGQNATNTWVHQVLGKVGQLLTFADVANFVIEAPSAEYIEAGNGVGGGAPRELGTNVAYGFNWVFGDTLSNYVSGGETDEGFVVSAPSAVPEPASLALLALGAGVALFRRNGRSA